MGRQEGWVSDRARPVLAAAAVVAGILMVLWLAVSLVGAVPAGSANRSGPTAGVVPPSSSEQALMLAPSVVFSDNFESNLGWTVNAAYTDTATVGAWERADPEPTDDHGAKQIEAYGGSYDLVTGPLAGSGAGQYDIDGGVTSVRSPAFELPAGAWDELDLSFYFYLAHRNDSSNDDYLRVKVVGETTTVWEQSGKNVDVDAAWDVDTVSLLDHAGETVYLLIEAADEAGDSLVEAAVDDVVITALDSTDPTSEAFSPLEVSGGSIPVDWEASDTASGLYQVCLWVKPPGGSWSDSGMCSPNPSGTFAFNPTDGAGVYYFQTVATDNAGNSEPAPSHDGDTETIWVPAQPVYLSLVLRAYAPLTNGGFEDGWLGWAHGGALRQSIISNDGWSGPHSGTFAAQLGDPTYACNGGVPLGTAWVERTITVPSSGVSSLRIWYRIFSQDFYSEPYYDHFQVLINGGVVHDDGNVAAFDYCNMAPISAGWEVVDVDVTLYLGKNITLRLENVSAYDNWYNTWTYVDDIQFVP